MQARKMKPTRSVCAARLHLRLLCRAFEFGACALGGCVSRAVLHIHVDGYDAVHCTIKSSSGSRRHFFLHVKKRKVKGGDSTEYSGDEGEEYKVSKKRADGSTLYYRDNGSVSQLLKPDGRIFHYLDGRLCAIVRPPGVVGDDMDTLEHKVLLDSHVQIIQQRVFFWQRYMPGAQRVFPRQPHTASAATCAASRPGISPIHSISRHMYTSFKRKSS